MSDYTYMIFGRTDLKDVVSFVYITLFQCMVGLLRLHFPEGRERGEEENSRKCMVVI